MHNKLPDTGVLSPIGPGQCACVETVIPDIWLRSEVQPDYLLGRPVVVGLLDQWGKLVYSLTFSLTGNAWTTTALALETALTDKVEYCAQYGVTISQKEWPVHFLPDQVVLERGVRRLLDLCAFARLGIRVAVAPPCKSALKSILEQHNFVNGQSRHWKEGAKVEAEKSEEHLPNNAVLLTPREFQRELIVAALEHNHALLKNYRLTPEMIGAGVQPRPVELFLWGLANRGGMLRTLSLNEARLRLLPRIAATVTACGIRCKGLHYVGEPAIRGEWFEGARRYGTWRTVVAYDPRMVDHIFLVPTEGAPGCECKLTLVESRFAGWTWAEVERWKKQQNTNTDSYHG